MKLSTTVKGTNCPAAVIKKTVDFSRISPNTRLAHAFLFIGAIPIMRPLAKISKFQEYVFIPWECSPIHVYLYTIQYFMNAIYNIVLSR